MGSVVDEHVRGPIEEFYSTRFHSQPKENRINCKKCECSKYRKKQGFWLDKFWNGYEENQP